MSNTSIASDAQGVIGTSYTTTVTYSHAEERLWRGNSYLDDELSYYDNVTWADDLLHEDSWENHYWYLGKRITLFTSSADFYGYRISFTRKNNTRLNYDEDYCSRAYWLVGSPTDLYNGQYASGNVDSSTFTAWVTTDNAVQSVHLAPYFKFTAYELRYADGENDTYHENFYDIYNIFSVTYTGYKTKSEYDTAMNDIKTELEDQTQELGDINTELDDQTEELETQTEELKEQTGTQKNILTKMTDFFGSFFENLKNSVIGLFVPSKEEMGELFNRLNQFFSDTFGFLYYPFDVFVRFVEVITTSESEVVLTLPGFSIMGHTVWEDITYNFGRVTLLQNIGGYAKTGSGAIIVFAFINYLRNFFDKRFGGGGT